MAVEISDQRLLAGWIGTLLFIVGWSLARDQDKKQSRIVGAGLVAIGMFAFAYSVYVGGKCSPTEPSSSKNSGTRNLKGILAWVLMLIIAASSFAILYASGTTDHGHGKSARSIAIVGQGGFVIGWLALAVFIGNSNSSLASNGFTGTKLTPSLVGAVLLLAGLLYFVPQQCKKGLCDGPGYALSAIGLLTMSIANSIF